MATSPVAGAQRATRHSPGDGDERMRDYSDGLIRHRRGGGGVAEIDPMNAPLPSSGRSVVAALVFVFCLLVPARAAHVAESAPKRLSAAEAHALGLPISNEDAGDLFKLWNECQPIAFSVHLQGKNEASKIGLTKEAIETAVRSRLRGARIFRNNPDLRSQSPKRERNGFLQVQVHLGATYVSWSIRFEKLMTDWPTDLLGWTPTGWRTGAFGGHRDDSYYIVSSIAPGIDEFIDDYLRVNESACGR